MESVFVKSKVLPLRSATYLSCVYPVTIETSLPGGQAMLATVLRVHTSEIVGTAPQQYFLKAGHGMFTYCNFLRLNKTAVCGHQYSSSSSTIYSIAF